MHLPDGHPENRTSIPLISTATDSHLQHISEEPLFPLNLAEMLETSKVLFKSSLPISLSSLSALITGMACLGFIGNYGSSSDLAGASLAMTWSSVFCYGILTSINVGFQIIASQLYGAHKLEDLVYTYRRTLCLFSVLAVPLLILLIIAEPLLITFGLSEDVAIKTGIYLKYSIPGLAGNAIFECTRGYLMAQNDFYVQGLVQAIAAVLHFFWCYIFVDLFENPLAGAAIAKSITDVSSAIVLLLYIKLSGINRQYKGPIWSSEYLKDAFGYLMRTLGIGANLYVFWLSYGISGFIVSGLNDEYIIGAHGLASTFWTVIFTFPSGNSLAMQTYLGNTVGEGSKNKAQKIVFTGFSLNTCYSLLNVIIMLFGNKFIAEFLTADIATQELVREMILIYMFIHVPDTLVDHLCGVLRTVGKERQVLISCICCSIIIGLTSQWYFGIALGYGYIGIWLSMGLAIFLLCASLAISFYNLDWGKTIWDIKQRIAKEKEEKDKGSLIELIESF